RKAREKVRHHLQASRVGIPVARARRYGSSLGRVLGWWGFQKNRVVARPKMLLTAFRAVNRSLDLWQMSQDVGIRLDSGRNQFTRQWASHHHGAHLRLSLGNARSIFTP